jgi:hypothetical protein
MEPLVFLGLVGLLVWILGGGRYYRAARVRHTLGRLPGLNATYSMIGADGTGLSIDTASKRIAFAVRGASYVYRFSEIISVEVCKNNVWSTKTNRGSQIAGALVGKALFGPLGFDIGGRTGSTTMSERINALSLRICVQDIQRPMHEISFYRGAPIAIGTRKFRRCAALLNEWHARINLAMSTP